MKVNMVIETKEIKAMVKAHLAARGFEVTDDDILIDKKGVVSVTVEAALEVALPVAPMAPTASAPPPHEAAGLPPDGPAPLGPPDLKTIQGGQAPADMSFVHNSNSNLVKQKGEGLYPKPSQTLIDGESFEYPGDDR